MHVFRSIYLCWLQSCSIAINKHSIVGLVSGVEHKCPNLADIFREIVTGAKQSGHAAKAVAKCMQKVGWLRSVGAQSHLIAPACLGSKPPFVMKFKVPGCITHVKRGINGTGRVSAITA